MKIQSRQDKPKYYFWINNILFQLSWIACVLGGNTTALTAALIFVSVHIYALKSDFLRQLPLITICVLIGVTVDVSIINFGILEPSTGLSHTSSFLGVPVWLTCLWVCFALALADGFSWLRNRYWLAALLGAIAGPLSYYGGTSLNQDLLLGTNKQFFIMTFSVTWAILLPLLVKIINLRSNRGLHHAAI